MRSKVNKIAVIGVVIALIITGIAAAFYVYQQEDDKDEPTKKVPYVPPVTSADVISFEYNFAEPTVEEHGDVMTVYVEDVDGYSIVDSRPVLPLNLTVIELPFGSEILDVDYQITGTEVISISKMLSYGKISPVGTDPSDEIYNSSELYPIDWVTYHTGGGLTDEGYKTFLSIRAYPVRYLPTENELHFIQDIEINVAYEEPEEPILEEKDEYDLLMIAPSNFERKLKPLIQHKQKNGIKTKFVTVENAVKNAEAGSDQAEKIKYYIKQSIEEYGIEYVLFVGGIKRQTSKWNIPIRYSHVVPPKEQEYPEESFITDLYFADIYDSRGEFSSWNTNGNNIFAEWNENGRDEMDLYPDVYVGRLPCRNTNEVKIMVNKIIDYETGKVKDKNWFKNMIVVAGDSYPDEFGYVEGEVITDKALELIPGAVPVKAYASAGEMTYKTINNAINQGGAFLYFCGHGSAISWGTHYPPDGKGWTQFYDTLHMNFLKNKEKLPVAVIGGCLNGKMDISVKDNIQKGFEKFGFKYFFGKFLTTGWRGHCWAWKLTVIKSGGAIATISNTGLGTHGREDRDFNGVLDYLEIINGWQELRFIQIYGEGKTILGENHGQTITEYLNRFMGDDWTMDAKMAQQWFVFGDPTLNIGGY